MLIYPERQLNDRGGLDPTIVVLDGAGLFMGVIPGVAALAVDAVTGTIYKPKGGSSANGGEPTPKVTSADDGERIPKVTSANRERRPYPKS